jgi:hypothetical protein
MHVATRGLSVLSLAIAATAHLAPAQTLLTMPETSQRAMISQRIGLTDITLVYHRPLVNGRKVWGAMVPYNQVWRAGANENTTVNFSTPVAVEGKPLGAGTYGLHMIPGTDEWTIIFSRNSSSWGSFTYKQDDDALRVTVKPRPAEMQEALAYEFEDLKPDSTAVTLHWERLAVPFRVSADKEVIMSSLRDQLRGGLQYTWQGPAEAAGYSLANKLDLDEGLKWADAAVQREERYDTLMLKAQILDTMGKTADSAPLKARALAVANAQQMYFYGRQFQLGQQKSEAAAMDVFRETAKRFPNDWVGHMAAARVSSAAGDYNKAAAELKIAIAGAPEVQKATIATYIKKLESGQDMNK